MTKKQFDMLVESSRKLKDFKISTSLGKNYTLNVFNLANLYSILRYLSDLVLESNNEEEKALIYGSIALCCISLYEENTKTEIEYEECINQFGDFFSLMDLITKIFSPHNLEPFPSKYLNNNLIVEIVNQCFFMASQYKDDNGDNIDLAELVVDYINKVCTNDNIDEVIKQINSQDFNTKYFKNCIYIAMPNQNIELCLENYSLLTIYFIKSEVNKELCGINAYEKEYPSIMSVYDYIQSQKELELKHTIEQKDYVSIFGNYASSNIHAISVNIKDTSFDLNNFLVFLKQKDLEFNTK